MNRHLTERDMLSYVDGELSRRRSRRVHSHLLSCWNCRRELERLEQDIHVIVDAQNQAFLPATIPPARPWEPFAKLAARVKPRRWRLDAWFRRGLHRLGEYCVGSGRSTTAAITLAGVIVTALWLTPAPLSAEIVLERMKQVERARTEIRDGQVIWQRVRVRRTDRRTYAQQSVEMESWKAGGRSLWRGDVPDLEARYRSRGFDAVIPLSSDASERWLGETRSAAIASQTRDMVQIESDGAPAGDDLQRVLLRINKRTWRLEGLQLTFADSIFDISRLETAVLAENDLAPDLVGALEPSAARPPRVVRRTSRVPAVWTHRGASIAAPEEARETPLEIALRVQYRLHEIGADLSEPIELTQTGSGIVIDAAAASEGRQEQLVKLFQHDPGVRIELQSAAIPGIGVPPSETIDPIAQHDPDQRIVDFFGGAPAEEAFTRTALQVDASVLARLYALRGLAQRWPAPAEAELAAPARDQLQEMVSDHIRALEAGIPELRRLMQPLIERFCSGGPAHAGPASPAGTWRELATSGLGAALTVDRNLRALLTTSTSDRTLGQACPAIDSELGALSSSVDNFPPAQ